MLLRMTTRKKNKIVINCEIKDGPMNKQMRKKDLGKRNKGEDMKEEDEDDKKRREKKTRN